MVNRSELKALVSLLDDPDELVYNAVKDKLLSIGEQAIPELENMWEFSHFEPTFQDRIVDLVHQIQFNSVKEGLKKWTEQDQDLLLGIHWINKYQYPERTYEELHQQIDKLARQVWLELNDDLTAFETVKVFNHILFDLCGFKANKTNYHSPQNSYISDVLESKRGNPLSLSVVYQLIASKVGVPIKGVNLPNHFILAYLDTRLTNLAINHPDPEVLFYINPFSLGTLINRAEIEQFLNQLKIEHEPEYFAPCGNRAIVRRMVNNLIYSYARLGYAEKVNELRQLESILSIDPAI
ncbi:MAG TPA: transglutaminase-like domain-containing protein [Luteibaculaceae bacterium]|nr:transglutaminase-like domain-containing protein [Luteibaculaceae bacterium]